MEYTAVIKRSGEWWIGWIEEVPGVNCQERTREELRRSLADTLSEALEFNRQFPGKKDLQGPRCRAVQVN